MIMMFASTATMMRVMRVMRMVMTVIFIIIPTSLSITTFIIIAVTLSILPFHTSRQSWWPSITIISHFLRPSRHKRIRVKRTATTTIIRTARSKCRRPSKHSSPLPNSVQWVTLAFHLTLRALKEVPNAINVSSIIPRLLKLHRLPIRPLLTSIDAAKVPSWFEPVNVRNCLWVALVAYPSTINLTIQLRRSI